ncbi:Dihydroorotate dehydrogenase [Rhodovulum sp. P5]|uniref:dihydroorotate dehydrogenase n=1 Tax=Rhodovulum sp. P5 TaxID=1564506 RepID=UPI0009C3C3DD|nr:dihydroorotate dehydrogenase [Rhodovulum sp. P5]ARE39621.1 Dihydroorotate dehydrogenase [Rhodovulum sp. P5]
MTDSELDTLFAAARTDRTEPSAAFLDRVMDDAMAACPAPAPERSARRSRPAPRGVLAGLVAALGGWPAMGGLATAGLFGLWIGYAAPGPLTPTPLNFWAAAMTWPT